MLLEHLRWTELGNLGSCVFLIPLGSLEQHGPHLPLITDTRIVEEIARQVESRLPDRVVLAPAQWLGHSPHHARFGSVSLHVRAYMDLLGGVCRSLAGMGARRVLLLNGHGGNDAPARAALCELKVELPDLAVVFASYWNLAAAALASLRTSPPGGMGHACEMETSLMLALDPARVNLAAAVDDGTAGETRWRVLDMLRPQPYYLVRDFHEISASGVVGMPSHASREKGGQFLAAITEAVFEFVRDFAAEPPLVTPAAREAAR